MGQIVVVFALDAGGLINDIQDTVAFTDRFGWAFRHAGTAGDAIFFDYHGHGVISDSEFLFTLIHPPESVK